jgi:hypothetical protein
MAKQNSITLKKKSALEELENRIVHKGGSKIGVTKKDKSKDKRKRKEEKNSKKKNRR